MKFILAHKEARKRALDAIQAAPDGWVVSIHEPKRNLAQNALLWELLHEVSSNVIWHGQKLEPETWKDIFTASLKRQKVVHGIDGGFVVCGGSTSKMGKQEFSNLIELINAFMAEQGIESKTIHTTG